MLMEVYQPLPDLHRNPKTHARHRREVFWQISFPLIIGVLICLLLSGLAVAASPQGASRWADISLIFLIFPVLVLSLIFLAINIASVYLLVKLIQVLPGYMFRFYGFLLMVSDWIKQVNNRAVEPFLRFEQFKASARTLGRQARRR